MSYADGGKIVTNGLVLSLDAADKNSYQGSGTTWNDLSGNNYTASLTNAPTFSSANGGRFSFNGSSNYITIPNINDLNFGSNNFSIELWINPTTPIPGGTLLSINANATYYAAVRLQVDETYGPGFLMSTTGTSFALSTGTTVTSWSRGTYNHLIVLRSGTNVLIYINGNLVNTFGPLNGSLMSFSASTVNRLGHISGTINSYYSGIVSILKVYNRDLSQNEIQQNYNAQKGRFGLT